MAYCSLPFGSAQGAGGSAQGAGDSAQGADVGFLIFATTNNYAPFGSAQGAGGSAQGAGGSAQGAGVGNNQTLKLLSPFCPFGSLYMALRVVKGTPAFYLSIPGVLRTQA